MDRRGIHIQAKKIQYIGAVQHAENDQVLPALLYKSIKLIVSNKAWLDCPQDIRIIIMEKMFHSTIIGPEHKGHVCN